MKKPAFILAAVLLLFTATINAQNETEPKQTTAQTEPATTLTTDTKQASPPTTTTTASADRWNNWSRDKYKMLPMPAPLTTEKIFPVLGHYSVATSASDATTTTGSTSDVTIILDETNKGIVWVEGLPQGNIKAYLRKSPGTYMIPAQKTADDKDLAQGVLIFDKGANTLDVCIGCTYNNDDPASSFTTPQPVVEEQPVAKTKHKKGTARAKITPVKTWRYSGSKTDAAESSSVVPMQQ
jgi:hypothetical protein